MGFKRLNVYLIKMYLGNFIATFCICLFIVLMQFLWKYVGDMVGKGLSMSILFEFFGLAGLSLVPMALPLSILLSSLMAFGNLGERFELIAMKAAGISLFRIFKPFVYFVTCISVGAFFYSNMVLPVIQDRLYILTRSMVQKSPEVEIPVGSFYQGVPGVSVFVTKKNADTKLLEGIMLYDFSGSSSTNSNNNTAADNISITCADSGRIEMSADQMNLVLTLHNGVTFENIRQQNRQQDRKSIPYRRENFKYKQIFVPFDNSMKMVDASITANKYVGKNFQQLSFAVDSLGEVSKKIADINANEMVNEHYFNRSKSIPRPDYAKLNAPENYFQKIFDDQNKSIQISILADAIGSIGNEQSNVERMYGEKDYMVDRNARRHDIERHRKITMSLACLLFFFIGAPIGSIIRKGGFGLPIVFSVVIFILYYVIDNSGYKMAREGMWHVWQGIWMSSGILFAFGSFLTYKAATDSMVNLSMAQFKQVWKNVKGFFSRKKKQTAADSLEEVDGK